MGSKSQWWEVGRAQIKTFCQQFIYSSTFMVKRTIERLEDEINNMEKELGQNNLGVVNEVMEKK